MPTQLLRSQEMYAGIGGWDNEMSWGRKGRDIHIPLRMESERKRKLDPFVLLQSLGMVLGTGHGGVQER